MLLRAIIPAVCLILTGCASLKYPGWERVRIEPTVYKQPCEYKGEEKCYESPENCPVWYQKRATVFGANTVVKASNGTNQYNMNEVGSYFNCAPGLPPFIAKPNSIWLARPNKFKPDATALDFEKAVAECTYETHKATIDTSQPAPARAFIPTTSYTLNSAQISAAETDRFNQSTRKMRLQYDQLSLYSECLIAKGFVHSRSATEADLAARNQYCPDLDNTAAPCFVPNAQ